MNKEELKERLSIFLLAKTITDEAAQVTEKAFDYLTQSLNQDNILQGEMLFTHLPLALTRLYTREEIEAPPEAVLNEAKQTVHLKKVLDEILYIEKQWGRELPIEEKGYLIIHYSVIFQANIGSYN
jgi:hypothetical protein